MSDIKIWIWLFPMLFIFHDFEEIIMMQSWVTKNRRYLQEKFPKISKRVLPHFDHISTASFTVGVAEEFVLVSIVTIVTYMTNQYILWVGLFIAFTIHLVIHCLQALLVRKYVPAIMTSIICLPICIYMIKTVAGLFPFERIVVFSMIAFAMMIVNLIFVHKGMKLVSRWLFQYEQQSSET